MPEVPTDRIQNIRSLLVRVRHIVALLHSGTNEQAQLEWAIDALNLLLLEAENVSYQDQGVKCLPLHPPD